MTTALKFDGEKAGLDLLPVQAKKAIAEVFDFGAKKYARHNWRNGFNWSRLIAAAERHLDAFNDGEDLDPESGKPHLAHLGCCVLMLLESTIKGYGMDDRYKEPEDEKISLSERKASNHEVLAARSKLFDLPGNITIDFTGKNVGDVLTATKQMGGLNESAKNIEKNNDARNRT